MKTFVLLKKDYEWASTVLVTWETLELYELHIENIYKYLIFNIETELNQLRGRWDDFYKICPKTIAEEDQHWALHDELNNEQDAMWNKMYRNYLLFYLLNLKSLLPHQLFNYRPFEIIFKR